MRVVAMYLRLSLEDRQDKEAVCNKNESNSISSQRMLLSSYIEQDEELKNFEIREFCDDGWSGTGMDRPGMNRLLAEVKKNRVQCIIVKDLSRFSRDYIELGTYLNQILPFMGVRLIAVSDRYDSREHSGSTIEMDTAFKTLLYDLYSKDLSVKVRTSYENKCARGEYVFGQTPLGYAKSMERKNEIVVNEEEAAVVRQIFAMAGSGISSTEIARILNEKGVPTTRLRRGQKPTGNGRHSVWKTNGVRKILKNRFYLGEMSYGKSTGEGVGSGKRKRFGENEWKVIYEHHKPLVTLEEFEKAAGSGHSTKRKREKHPFVGKLACGGCGYAMVYKPLRYGNRYQRFECSQHAVLKIPECCTYFRAEMLGEIVLSMLTKELMLRAEASEQAENMEKYLKSEINALEKKIRKMSQENSQIGNIGIVLYEKYASGEMTKEDYRKAVDEAEREKALRFERLTVCQEELIRMKEEQGRLQADMRQVIRYSHMETLTQEMVDTFIKKIYVYKDKRVEIEWNFKDGWKGDIYGRAADKKADG